MEAYNNELYDTEYQSRCGTLGWLCVGGLVAGWDICAKETLSHAAERGLENKIARPVILAAIALTGSHLAGIIPDRYDPLKRFLGVINNVRG